MLNKLSYLEHVLVLAGVHLLAEGDVVPDGHVLDPGLLRHVRHGAAGLQPALGLHQSQLSIETADQSQHSIYLHHLPEDGREQRGLAAANLAHHGHQLSAPDVEV